MTPQLIMLALVLFGLGAGMIQHGTPHKKDHNFFTDVLAISIGQGLLYWGGFYDEVLRRLELFR